MTISHSGLLFWATLYIIGSAHNESYGMYVNSVRQLVTQEIKRHCCTPEIV